MLLSRPPWARRRQERPALPRCLQPSRGSGCSQVPSWYRSGVPKNSSLPVSVPLLLTQSRDSRYPARAPSRASLREAVAPASPSARGGPSDRLSRRGLQALEGTHRLKHRSPGTEHCEQTPPGWPPGGNTQPLSPGRGGSGGGEAACGHRTSSALTFPFPTLCISCCLGREVNFCSNFTREFVGRSAMGSWCAASKHPWRHAQKFGGILQPRHLARACCGMAAARKLLASPHGLFDDSLPQGKGELRQLCRCPPTTHLHLLGEQGPEPGTPSGSTVWAAAPESQS